MWILESLSEIPFRKPLLILLSSLGAGFLLLADFFRINALYFSATYAFLALILVTLYLRQRNWKAFLLLGVAAISGVFLIPQYLPLYALVFTFFAAKALFPETFRYWKWAVSAVLFYASILIVSRWQNIGWIYSTIPLPAVPAVFGMLFGFCQFCAYLVFQFRKDRVAEFMESYRWKAGSEVEMMVSHIDELYRDISSMLSRDPKIKTELQDFTVKLLNLCQRSQKITVELHNYDGERLERSLQECEEKLAATKDRMTREQYAQTLANKKRHKEHFESLTMQAERLRAQILNYISALENMRFSYANREFSSSAETATGIEFFLHLAKTRSDQANQEAEGYEKLMA